ncbi:hypothetical protein, partial [Bordetella tumbae]
MSDSFPVSLDVAVVMRKER